jgi:deoxyuridine 5'-triphosphate nucleotidohydrolase
MKLKDTALVTLNLEIKKLHPEANLPTKANPADAGLDLYCFPKNGSPYAEIAPGKSALVGTGISVSIPEGYFGYIRSRSGLASKNHLEVGAGVVDGGYTGEVCVLLRNHGDRIQYLVAGDRIAQLLILPVPKVNVVEVKEFTTVVGERGDGGFGSSGV